MEGRFKILTKLAWFSLNLHDSCISADVVLDSLFASEYPAMNKPLSFICLAIQYNSGPGIVVW